MKIESFAQGQWYFGSESPRKLHHAVNGEDIGAVDSSGLDVAGMLDYARKTGGPSLREMTFHERAIMLKQIAIYLLERKKDFYELSYASGATKRDAWVDIDGGIGTFFVYSGKGRREMPDDTVYVDGPMEVLSKEGTFVGRHVCLPLQGAAVHINAFNFPCWGMLEKLAPTFLAGMPAIVKPATLTSYITQAVVKAMLESTLLPPGALQLICGGVGDLFEHLDSQDVVTFTGSATTGRKLKSHPRVTEHAIRFNMEADSLNCCILGPDVEPSDPEFDFFIKEVVDEMTIKTGQRCTAIRRTFVPQERVDDVVEALKAALHEVKIGDPKRDEVQMGPLAGRPQVKEVFEKVEELKRGAEVVFQQADYHGGDPDKGAFSPTTLLYCDEPFQHEEPHNVEAFGPVNTVMPYKSLQDSIHLAALGKGSLVGSLFTADDRAAREVVTGIAPYHGRLMIINRHCAKESTGHGSPLPHLVHGGPGRAGGGEELGGVRGVMHYMQRTALQGSPTTLTRVANEWMKGAAQTRHTVHPFQKYFEELEIGETLVTHRRTITEADVTNFAGVSGDYFYAHTDKIAAAENPIFEERVAHGYFLIAAAAGLFVHPAQGPVLANYGLDNLRFIEPVYIGDTIHCRLTCKRKIFKHKKEEDEVPQGIVEWDVEIFNQDDETVANYTILTLVRRKDDQRVN
ncbi:MAG TPA: phenylacetic acid degradation bifunctional protein PaaZ [Acidobacteriota bacterium]|nr:phenylacetic acid degradation bifunctional protein PaaZ [Acidobacteriota bacterium]